MVCRAHYNVQMLNIAVNGVNVTTPSAFEITTSGGGVIFDSGTTLSYLTQPAYGKFLTAVCIYPCRCLCWQLLWFLVNIFTSLRYPIFQFLLRFEWTWSRDLYNRVIFSAWYPLGAILWCECYMSQVDIFGIDLLYIGTHHGSRHLVLSLRNEISWHGEVEVVGIIVMVLWYCGRWKVVHLFKWQVFLIIQEMPKIVS